MIKSDQIRPKKNFIIERTRAKKFLELRFLRCSTTCHPVWNPTGLYNWTIETFTCLIIRVKLPGALSQTAQVLWERVADEMWTYRNITTSQHEHRNRHLRKPWDPRSVTVDTRRRHGRSYHHPVMWGAGVTQTHSRQSSDWKIPLSFLYYFAFT